MSEEPKPGDLCVWHIPQVPGQPFRVLVESVAEGKKLCDVLADYDDFQFKNRIKPDYSNANGVSRWEDVGDGPDWYDVDEDEPFEDESEFAEELDAALFRVKGYLERRASRLKLDDHIHGIGTVKENVELYASDIKTIIQAAEIARKSW